MMTNVTRFWHRDREREREKNARVYLSNTNNKWPPFDARGASFAFETEIDFYVRERRPDRGVARSIVSVFLNEGILFQSLADRNRANHCDYATTLVHGTSLEAHVPKWPRPRGFVVTNTRWWRGIKGLKIVVTDPSPPLVRTQPAYRRGRGTGGTGGDACFRRTKYTSLS